MTSRRIDRSRTHAQHPSGGGRDKGPTTAGCAPRGVQRRLLWGHGDARVCRARASCRVMGRRTTTCNWHPISLRGPDFWGAGGRSRVCSAIGGSLMGL
eukprot:9496854-Pyramimonas_sp.AAC.1